MVDGRVRVKASKKENLRCKEIIFTALMFINFVR